jgi:hypothetical protein
MRREFYDIYRGLEERYRVSESVWRLGPLQDPRLPFPIGGIQLVEDAISDTLIDLRLGSDKLRPDARLFLVTNMYQMIFLPIASSSERKMDGGDISKLLRADLRTILDTAQEQSSDEEISSHAVFNAVSQVWDKLRATELDVWG